MSSNAYRPDIDGLRAVAVASVIAYHINPQLLPGGFAGVDIFFVISGFLITGLITGELRKGSFSLWNFYARRVRRIYPALLTVVIATLLASAFLLLPRDYADLADSARWAVFGLSNLFFWARSGYFAPAAAELPLLHTWSLGVEEQFYLAWPLLVGIVSIVWRRSRWPLTILALATIVLSLASAFLGYRQDPNGLFYSPLARAWELGLGALVSMLPSLRPKWLGPVAGLIGAGLVLAALLRLAPLRSGDNLRLLIAASVGASLLVWPQNQRSLVGAALALQPLQRLGRMSYSLYLWHWPMLALLGHGIYVGEPVPNWAYAIYLPILLALAASTWWWVERPFRRARGSPRRAVALGALAAGCVAIVATVGVQTGGWPARFAPEVARYVALAQPPQQRPPDEVCFIYSAHTDADFTQNSCVVHDSHRPNVLILGDSHADHYVAALTEIYPEIQFSEITASGCLPLLHTVGASRCTNMMAKTFGTILRPGAFDAIILSARWTAPHLTRAGLVETLQALATAARSVIVLGPNGEYTTELPDILAYATMRGGDAFVRARERNDVARAVDQRMRSWVRRSGRPFSFRPIYEIICPARQCRSTAANGDPMFYDSNHLTRSGAAEVVTALRKAGMLSKLIAR